MKLHFTLFAAVGLAALISSAQAKAQLLDFGTTYTIEGQGFTGTGSPPNFTENVQLSSSTVTFDNRKLQITETQTPWRILAPIRSAVRRGVFVEFYIHATRRSRQLSPPPLVDPSTVNNVWFEVGLSGVQLKVPAINNAEYLYWNFTRNGVADAGITADPGNPWGVEANPNPGSIGAGKNVFHLSSCFLLCSNTPVSQITSYLGEGGPSNTFIKNLNIDPKFNGYFVGFKLEYPPNPPPT
jgi:hypothetical protein